MVDVRELRHGGVSRRSVLISILAVAVGGCTPPAQGGSSGSGSPTGTRTALPTGTETGTGTGTSTESDRRLASAAADATRLLQSRYEATMRKHPRLGARLRPLADEHEAHLAALLEHVQAAASPPGTVPAVRAPAVPATAVRSLGALAAAERSAARGRLAEISAASPRLARLLAGIGGAEAAHAFLLGAGA